MSRLLELAKVRVLTTGAGASLQLGAAVESYRTLAAAGGASGQRVHYLITQVSQGRTAWERSQGVLGAGATTVGRTLVASSTGALLNLNGNAVLEVVQPGAQTPQFDLPGDWEAAQRFRVAPTIDDPEGWREALDAGSTAELAAATATAAAAAEAAESASTDAQAASADVLAGLAEVNTRTVETEDDYAEVVVDGRGAIAATIHKDGTHEFARAIIHQLVDPAAVLQLLYDWVFLLVYGQSLSTGQRGTPPISTTARANRKMLGATRTYPLSPYTATALADQVEATASQEGETPVAGMLDHIVHLLAVENGIDFSDTLIGASAGVGGTAMAGLNHGTTPYNRLLGAVDRLVALAAAANRTLAVPAFMWMQGESDYINNTTQSAYVTLQKALRSDLDTDLKAGGRLPGNPDLQMITYQLASHSAGAIMKATPSIAMALLQAANEDANIHLACPMYQFDYADDIHLTAQSYRVVGGYMAQAYKRIVIDGATWKPLQPLSKHLAGNSIVVVFDVPTPPLVLDAGWVLDPGNYGFQLVDASDVAIAITSVELVGRTRVRLNTASARSATDKVRYGWGPAPRADAGRMTGNRGNLRDSEMTMFDAGGLAPRRLHNWCVIFEI